MYCIIIICLVLAFPCLGGLDAMLVDFGQQPTKQKRTMDYCEHRTYVISRCQLHYKSFLIYFAFNINEGDFNAGISAGTWVYVYVYMYGKMHSNESLVEMSFLSRSYTSTTFFISVIG